MPVKEVSDNLWESFGLVLHLGDDMLETPPVAIWWHSKDTSGHDFVFMDHFKCCAFLYDPEGFPEYEDLDENLRIFMERVLENSDLMSEFARMHFDRGGEARGQVVNEIRILARLDNPDKREAYVHGLLSNSIKPHYESGISYWESCYGGCPMPSHLRFMPKNPNVSRNQHNSVTWCALMLNAWSFHLGIEEANGDVEEFHAGLCGRTDYSHPFPLL
ncbi:MAG TPA: hypothetical protein VGB77_14895 [Abditibacteriaceae bacterium]|jgi:hypothetical protein